MIQILETSSRFAAIAKNIATLAEIILTKYKLGLAVISLTLSDKQLQPYSPFDLELYTTTIIAHLKEYLIKTITKPN